MSILETLVMRRAKQPEEAHGVDPEIVNDLEPDATALDTEPELPLTKQLEKMVLEAKQALAQVSEPLGDLDDKHHDVTARPETVSTSEIDEVEEYDDEDDAQADSEDADEGGQSGESPAVMAQADSVASAQASAIAGTIRELSERSTRMRSLSSLHGVLEGQLRNMSEVIALSQRTWASVHPFLENFERDAKRLDIMESEAGARDREIQTLRRSNQEMSKTLSVREGEVNAAVTRYNEIRTEAERVRRQLAEREGERDRLRTDLNKVEVALGQFRNDIAFVTTQYERETVAKENVERARQDLERKYAALQGAEGMARSKLAEISLQHEKLAEQLPAIIEEYKTVQSELKASHREKAELQGKFLSAHDRIAQLEHEIRLSESQSAAEAFAARNEVELTRSQLRTAHEAASELGLRLKELQAKIGVNETWRHKAEHEMALRERDAENARKEAESAVAKVSELNLRYTTDLLTIDQLRDQNRQLQQTLEAAQGDNQRLAKFENLYKSAEGQIVNLRTRLDSLIKAAQTTAELPSIAPSDASLLNIASEAPVAESSNVVDLKETKGSKAPPRPTSTTA